MKEFILGNKIIFKKINNNKLFNILVNDNNSFGIYFRNNDEIIGYFSIDNKLLCILDEYINTDIAIDIIKLLINYCFNELKLKVIELNCDNKLSNLLVSFNFVKIDNLYKLNKENRKTNKKIKNKYLTGEDIDMINDRNYSNKQNICDNHWDGA